MRDFKNIILSLFVLVLICLEAKGQCVDDSNVWIESWTSCEVSANPNAARGNTVWVLYEFAEPQAIATTHIWNANRLGESGQGGKTVFMDVSTDGNTWIQVGADAYTWAQGTELDNYEGFAGPDLSDFGFVEKILFTFVNNHEASTCISLGELRFDINQEACYGIIDACGICDGPGLQTYYEDADHDGLGNPNASIESCDLPVGYVENANDNCDNGLLGWETIAPVFSDNGCNACHNGPGAQGGLDLTSYAGISAGGNRCGTNILTGTVMADIIFIPDYAGCSSPISFPSMNARVGGAMDAAEVQLIQDWIDDGALEDCRCPDGSTDSDGDGICDDSDICPDFDDALIGTSCDDGDPCTIQDMMTASCDCVGLPAPDTDFDGICDAADLAPNDPCTADGIFGMPEPAGWYANDSNDCDGDLILVSEGDINDYDACINHQGASLSPACACPGTSLVGGGKLIASDGVNSVFDAEGKPDGNFTNNINNSDFMTLSFPYMELGAEICFTLSFSTSNGIQFEVNDLGIYKFQNPDPTLTDFEAQVICFPTFMAGPQKIKISRYITGTVRIDGATYEYCPCTESDPSQAFTSCACPDDLSADTGAYTTSTGINDAELAGGVPDGMFTGNIGQTDSLVLTYPSAPENYEICLDVLFSSIEGRISVNTNDELLLLSNPAGFGEEGLVQQICFFTNSNESQTIVVKEIGVGTMQIDGSTSRYCNACAEDVDADGVCDVRDVCLSGDDSLDEDADGIPDACDDCNGNLIGRACDDGNSCTSDDIYDANCNCVGVDMAQSEIPYNGIDDDCDPLTLDDDLDQDGFVLAEDCDDTDASISPGQTEVPYDGIDNDCDPLTLDDDLDQDGFVLAEDCDDTDATINIDATEIPNNGIDEDCDGADFLTSIRNLGEHQVKIYPNPAASFVNIEVTGIENIESTLYDLLGKKVKVAIDPHKLMLTDIPSGVYLLEIRDTDTDATAIKRLAVARLK